MTDAARHDGAVPLIFAVGLASALIGDWVVRLEEGLHHAGWGHGLHTILLAIPAGMLAALLLREDRIVAAALVAVGGWAAGSLILFLI